MPSSVRRSVASLHSTAAGSSPRAAGRRHGCHLAAAQAEGAVRLVARAADLEHVARRRRSLRTVISFRVRVPVLSEQMTVTEPSVSTAGRRRMMALRRAMRSTPIASVIVMTAGRPSGMAATASADRGQEHLAEAVAADQDPERKGQRRESEDRAGEPAGEARHLAKQRRGQRLDLRQQLADAADLGGRAGGDDDAGALAVGHERARVGHRGSGRRAAPRRRPGRSLLDRQRLAGQRRLLDLQALGLDQAQIGGHPVARLQEHDVARHQLLGRYGEALAAADHDRLGRQHVPDGVERLLGLALLDVADHGIDHDHGQYHRRVDPVRERRRHRGGGSRT